MEMAEKIFVSISYKDGLIRLGDHYYKKGQILQALDLYKKAQFQPRIQELAEQMLAALKTWLKEE